jgi:hypothetical protein
MATKIRIQDAIEHNVRREKARLFDLIENQRLMVNVSYDGSVSVMDGVRPKIVSLSLVQALKEYER